MAFTPQEIESKQFLVTLRGYDKDEVAVFLRAVAADYRSAIEQAQSSGAVSARSVSADPYAQVGGDVAEILRAANETANAVRQRADEEAAELRRSTEEEAALLRRTVEDETGELRRQANHEAEAARQVADEEIQAVLEASRTAREEAERRAHEVLDSARREADQLLTEARSRHERIAEAEREVRHRLQATGTMLRSALGHLDREVEVSAGPPEPAPDPVSELEVLAEATLDE